MIFIYIFNSMSELWMIVLKTKLNGKIRWKIVSSLMIIKNFKGEREKWIQRASSF